MEKITSLAKTLQSNASSIPHLANFTLRQGEVFSWDHTACAVTFDPASPLAAPYLLHEYSHALLGHTTYRNDIELLHMERAAWDTACKLADSYGVMISEDTIEDALDTYRNWLHNRSLCPRCRATGIQTYRFTYRCIACDVTWRVNEARSCALRRYVTKKRP